jgi:hypothetical protein
MFSGDGHASRDTGLLIASSLDGIHFRNIQSSPDPVYLPPGGLRDPIVQFWRGCWYLLYTYGPNTRPLVIMAKSANLLDWELVTSLRLAQDSANNYIDVPQWIVDPTGALHIIACVDDTHNWAEIHPLSCNPANWGDPANWSAVSTLTDYAGAPLVQGNSFVTCRGGVYSMAFNEMQSTGYFLRTSTNLISGWSAPRSLPLDSTVNYGDSENLVVLSDDSLRFYISNGNTLRKVIWFVDSSDQGARWTSPQAVQFSGFDPAEINWAQFVRISEPAAIANLVNLWQA